MKESLFYDTGYSMEGDSWSWDLARIGNEVDSIAKILKIDRNIYHDELVILIENATYGGHLVLYFFDDIENYNNITDNLIAFTHPNIAVIDTEGGSGFNIELTDITIKFPFQRNHLYKDTDTPYAYATDVCGMIETWCEDTIVHFENSEAMHKDLNGNLSNEIEHERQYQQSFDQGKCTFGDMNITRHKDTIYTNDFPCGQKCPSCHTFWID